jgi:hypothetical protein
MYVLLAVLPFVRLISQMRINRQLRCCCSFDVEQACAVMR